MYKSRLQEICHQRSWGLPSYTQIREGLDHTPQFKASVLVNGLTFDSPDFTKSAKDAQNEAAKVAFHHFTAQSSSSSPSGSSCASNILGISQSGKETFPGKVEIPENSPNHGNVLDVGEDKEFTGIVPLDVAYIYKGQLQTYAQKRNLNLPLYSCVREGSPHCLRFKSTVTVDGQTFESPTFFRTLKEAEHAAAKAALCSLSNNGIQKDDCGLFKSLLQTLTVKEGFSTPVYTTSLSGESHAPTFSAAVEVEGDVFSGLPAKTKKQAETNAAKVAYFSLKQRIFYKTPVALFPDDDALEAFEFIYPSFGSSLTLDLQKNLNLKDPDVDHEAAPDKLSPKAGAVNIGHATSPVKPETTTEHVSEPLHEPVASVPSSQEGSSSPMTVLEGCNFTVAEQNTDKKPAQEGSSSLTTVVEGSNFTAAEQNTSKKPAREGSSSPKTVLEGSYFIAAEQNTNKKPAQECSLLGNRVVVYPRKQGWTLPEGAIMLPISDDKWVAVSLEYPS